MLYWQAFCEYHEINGDRFRQLMEPLMDLPTPLLETDGTVMSLRDFGSDLVMQVELLLSGPPHTEAAIKLWVACAMFLARHADQTVPGFMQVSE